jgi:hypothetical protein
VSRLREAITFGLIYFFLSFINLRSKMVVTVSWYDGMLKQMHNALLAFQYTNNEQSRLLQFYIPELIRQVLHVSIPYAYIVQRWLFVFLAFLLFHFYLKKWFDTKGAFAGVVLMAAIMPLVYFDHLQESAPLLLVTFLLALWMIRERRTPWYIFVLFFGAINNETMLFLPAAYWFYNFERFELRHLIWLSIKTVLTALPAFLVVGFIRLVNIDRPHLGGAWHLPDNIKGIMNQMTASPLDYWRMDYLFIFFVFNVLWIYAFLKFQDKPLFLRRVSLLVPIFIGLHMLTGIIAEVRQMVPLSFIIIPMALGYLFPSVSHSTDTIAQTESL